MVFNIRKSLGAEIFLYILVVSLIPSITILYFSTNKLKEKLHNELVNKLNSSEAIIVSDLKNIKLKLINTIVNHSKADFLIAMVENETIPNLHTAINYLKTSSGLDLISIFDVDGRLITTTDEGLTYPMITKDLLKKLEESDSDNFYITRYSIVNNNSIMLNLFSPIVEPYYKYLQGVIQESILIDREFLVGLSAKLKIDIALFSSKKESLISTIDKVILNKKSLSQLINSGRKIEINSLKISGETFHTILLPFKNDNTTVIGAIALLGSEKAINESIQNIHFIFLLTILLISIFAVIVALISRKQIVSPIMEVITGLNKTAVGDLTCSISVKKENEIGRLAASFNSMTIDLKDTTVSKNFMDNIFKSMIDALIVTDNHSIIINLNDAVEKVYGYSKDELINKNINILFSDDISGSFNKILQNLLGGIIIKESNLTIKSKDGRYIPISINGSPIKDSNGNITAIVLVLKDMREIMTMIGNLKKLNKQLQQTQANLIQAGKMAAMGQLSAGIAHELNQPLTGIKGFSQLLLEDIKDSAQRGMLDKIVNQTVRMGKIITNLRTFARQSLYEYKDMDIKKCIEEAFSLFTQQFEELGISINFNFKGRYMIYGDFNQIQQVFINMISNAKDSLEDIEGERKLTVSTSYGKNPDEIEIIFMDSGTGIPENIKEEIFNPFFTTKSIGKGTGLGLSISHGIIEKHCGILELINEANGASFKITLPVSGSIGAKKLEKEKEGFTRYPLGSLEE